MTKRFRRPCGFLLISVYRDERGAAALIVFLVVLAVSLIVVSTTSLTGVGNLSIGFSTQASSDVVLSAESCVEEAFVRLTRDNSYAGGMLTVGDSTCTVSVTGIPCGACTVDVEATGNNFTRQIRAGVTMSGSTVNVTSWEEVE